MRRIYGPYIYSDAPREDCWWAETVASLVAAPLDENVRCDVAIVGGGFTGLNAALVLAQAGVDVALLEAHKIGWGASGRNGGFCCLGGGKIDDSALDRRYGKAARLEWRRFEVAAVHHVADLLAQYGIDADVHSDGETCLAHRPKDMKVLEDDARAAEENYGVKAQIHSPEDLKTRGLSAGFYGGSTIPIGFALNPAKYLEGLRNAVLGASGRIFENSPVATIERTGSRWTLKSGPAVLEADQVLVATNGYSSEDLPPWIAGRYLPTQSNVAVTRPLTNDELVRQGWTSHQMCFDSRHLLHYFRLMPDNRMLFGMRGGLGENSASDKRAHARLNRDFRTMFPAWRDVPFTHRWSGMVCFAAQRLPILGSVPGHTGMSVALAYHGNGVAMGSLCGALIAQQMLARSGANLPRVLNEQAQRFPLGRARRLLLPAAYAAYALADRF